MARYTREESAIPHFLFADRRMAWVWLLLRLYLGYEWLSAGIEKATDAQGAWIGATKGAALTQFINQAVAKASGPYPDVQGWYASFLHQTVLPNVVPWSYLVTSGEILVGSALILGFFVGISVVFGMFMNLNFMLAGSVSINPIMFTIGIGLALAWRVSGYIGLDRYALPVLHSVLRKLRIT